MIAFVGSVFSPYYHFAGRRDPERHVAFNVALYGPPSNAWAMTERGRRDLRREPARLAIAASEFRARGEGFEIDFDEVFLPWPGHRLLPKRMSGSIVVEPRFVNSVSFDLDGAGCHHWLPVAPSSRIKLRSADLPDGGWSGEGYHDMNWGSRPLEADFRGWDWGQGHGSDGQSIILYDSVLADGARRGFGLRFDPDGRMGTFAPPPRQRLARGFWGVEGGVACDMGTVPRVIRKLEDSPFYRRSLVTTRLAGDDIAMMHESLDCHRLSMPLVRLMLPFRMPRRG
ncbi:carotenoid 1,2-hydratase [Rhizobium sp. CRIBSB]|nr:carotenoid 1,2-hydratase [Rhizobium sp. CRIBSB]